MKITRILALLFSAILFLSSCGEPETVPVDTENPFFELKTMPEIAFDNAGLTIPARVKENYVTYFTASSDYGKVVPFVTYYGYFVGAKPKKGEAPTGNFPFYGFMTADGRVICDAVYNAVTEFDNGDGRAVYEMCLGTDRDTTAVGTRYVVSSTGSWIIKLAKGCKVVNASGGIVAVEREKKVNKELSIYYTDLYNIDNGRMVGTVDTSIAEAPNVTYKLGNFASGLAPINIETFDPETKTSTYKACYIDTQNRHVLDSYSFCGEFTDDLAIVVDADGKYGVLKPDGKYFIDPIYNGITYDSLHKYFVCLDAGYIYVLNMDKKQIKKVFSESGTIRFCDCDTPIYEKIFGKTDKREFFVSETNSPFICKDTGQMPDPGSGVGGFFWCSYNGSTTVFDSTGATFVRIKGIGDINFVTDTAVVMTDDDGKRTAVIGRASPDGAEWMEKSLIGRAGTDGRYIILMCQESGKNSYSVYDTVGMCTVLDGKNYIAAFGNMLSAVSDSGYEVYDGDLNPVFSCRTSFCY